MFHELGQLCSTLTARNSTGRQYINADKLELEFLGNLVVIYQFYGYVLMVLFDMDPFRGITDPDPT